MEQIITDFWDLDCDLVPKTEPGLFFRVTETQANGLFDVKQGGAFMTAKEFGGRYDFKLKFATSVWDRQAKKQELVTFYQLAVQNPIVATSPRAMWTLINRVAKTFGIDDFELLVPKPPELDEPKTPELEWTQMLEGQVVHVNPGDNDAQHIQAHNEQRDTEAKDPDRDKQAIGLIVKHIQEHRQQERTKMLMQALTQHLMEGILPQQQAQQQLQGQLGHLQAMHQAMQQGQPQGQPQQGQPGMPLAGPPQAGQPPQQGGAGGDIPMPPQQVGSTQAPVAHDGQM